MHGVLLVMGGDGGNVMCQMMMRMLWVLIMSMSRRMRMVMAWYDDAEAVYDAVGIATIPIVVRLLMMMRLVFRHTRVLPL